MDADIRNILGPLGSLLRSVDDAIVSRLSTGIPQADASAAHLFSSGGKRIRASLVLLAAGIKTPLPEGIIDLAAATEIVHAATLIHDDIIDQSFLRRGSITVPRKWGNKLAVLIGDYMYTVSLSIALADANPAIFPLMVNGTKDMVHGELYQLQYSNIDSINRQHYMTIIELKTAKFMAACTELGAVKAGLPGNEVALLKDFGLNLGFAFQIIDDLLDVTDQDASRSGKDIGNDIRDGKITLPLLHYLERRGDEGRERLKAYLDNPQDEIWQGIVKDIRDTGAIEETRALAARYLDTARSQLGGFPDSEYRRILMALADFLLVRQH